MIIIAVDGVAGSGKSSTAKVVAKRLDLIYIDTGAMYRAVTLYALENSLGVEDDELMEHLESNRVKIHFQDNGETVFLNDRNVTKEIRTEPVNALVSKVAAIGRIRELMVIQQRDLANSATSGKGVIMDGRDIGSVVFPDADLKVYMTASARKRAQRRLKEMEDRNISCVTLEECEQSILHRDLLDSSRKVGPLVKCKDAVVIDTTDLNFEDQVNKIIELSKNLE